MSVANRLRRRFYADSVALMRVARELSRDGVVASLVIGTPSNKALLRDAGLLTAEGEAAGPDDLVIAAKGRSPQAALARAEQLLDAGAQAGAAGGSFPTLDSALAGLAGANLALVSVPGEYAAAQARRALERGLHVMLFSDNVPLEDEVALKDLALARGLLMMGPDCGTALIGGAPIAFANAVPRGGVGLVSASGTGLQEVSTLLARRGEGVSHGIGVGGRDLSAEVGARMTLAALEALEADEATTRIVLISKPPAPEVTARVVARAQRCRKPVTLCLLGAAARKPGPNVALARTLEEAGGGTPRTRSPAVRARGRIRGLFCGGTLCAEAQVVLLDRGLEVSSNAPVPGAAEDGAGHLLLDLGDDEYTRGRPHPMIEPELRNEHIARALRDRNVGVILVDLVLGYGAHPDPAGLLAAAVKKSRKPVIASVTGTEGDPQVYSRQVATLERAGVVVAASNAQAARWAAAALRR
jgi:FdrA protein